MVREGQLIIITYSSGTTENSARTVEKVYGNGRIKIRGKVGTWYEDEPGMFRMFNDPGYTPMVGVMA